MLSVNLLRTLRGCGVPRSFSSLGPAALRHAARLSGGAEQPLTLQAFARSFPVINKVQFYCPSTRCLSSRRLDRQEHLIYTGSLGRTIRGVKLFCYSTTGASLCLMPQIMMTTGFGVDSFALHLAFCGILVFCTFITPILLHLLTRGYVIRLYHNPVKDTYTAITCSIFLTEKKTMFHQSQVKIPAVNQMFINFYADKTGLLVNPDLFPFPHDYNHLMGYDKPFSFNPDDMDQPDKS